MEYGRLEVASDDLGVEQALLVTLREFREVVLAGWRSEVAGAQPVVPGQVFVDSGYMAPVVYAFCRETGDRFGPAMGRGAAQQHRQWYNRPTQTGSVVQLIGEGYHVNWLPAEQLYLVEADADHWKTWVHQRLQTLVGGHGAMTLFKAEPREHLSLAKHLTAEAKTEEFVAGKGVVVKWKRLRRQNHWFDALYNGVRSADRTGTRFTPVGPGEPRPSSVDRPWGDVPHPDYLGFMRRHNGCDGPVGQNGYVRLWPLENVILRTEQAKADDFAPGLLLFAGDGGNEAYAFDRQDPRWPIVAVPPAGLSRKEMKVVAGTFAEFLRKLASDAA